MSFTIREQLECLAPFIVITFACTAMLSIAYVRAGLKVDELTERVAELESNLKKHTAPDGIGRVDYALAMGGGEGGGGRVLKHSEPYIFDSDDSFMWLFKPGVHPDAYKMLKPSLGEAGQCFALQGNRGFVVIRLGHAIIPEAITLEHVDRRVADHNRRSNAPKDCLVSGWLASAGHNEYIKDYSEVELEKRIFLTQFAYDLDDKIIPVQTFNVSDYAATKLIDTVRFDFTSNHGHPKCTCIYRFRVHGHEPADSSAS